MTEPATPVECALAIDTLQKFAEERATVTIVCRGPAGSSQFHVELREGVLSDPLDIEAWSPKLTDAIASALDLFRRAWADDRPSSKTGPTMRFCCAGPCWTGDCDCRNHDGKLDPEERPPLHEGCYCVLEPVAEEVAAE